MITHFYDLCPSTLSLTHLLIFSLMNSIREASPCTSTTLRGGPHCLTTCKIPLASAWALNERYRT